MSKKLLLNCLFSFLIVNGLIAQDHSKEKWTIRYSNEKTSVELISTTQNGFTFKSGSVETKDLYAFCQLRLDEPIKSLSFSYTAKGNTAPAQIALMDAGANELWHHEGSSEGPQKIELTNLKAHGQLIFKITAHEASEMIISDLQYSTEKIAPILDKDGFILIDNINALRSYASQDDVKVRLVPGFYQLDKTFCKQFIEFTGNNSVYDLTGVKIMVDTKLFSRTDIYPGRDDAGMYCAIAIHGKNVQMEGLYIETYGDSPGIQSRNKVFNLTGKNVTLKNTEIRTSGSNPWGYGSFYGLGGGDVRKMNGIRIAWPGENIKVIGCKVHMRAMGHAIFVQGAKNTLIEDCHVDGLLRTTDEILQETSGYAFDKNFKAHRGGYIEGVIVADDGTFLPGEMFSLSEDGIRVYPQAQRGANTETGSTTIKDCTVTNMRRGICTGLNTASDKVINCRVTNCYAAGFNVGNLDSLINCSADAKYAEAFCVPYTEAKNAYVEMEILDSRDGMKNKLLAKVNGMDHQIKIKTSDADFIPEDMAIKLSTTESYGGPWRGGIPNAINISITNETDTKIILLPGTEKPVVKSKGEVIDQSIEGTKKNKKKKD